MQPTVRQLLLSAPAVPAAEQQDSVFHQVQTMFAHLAGGVSPSFEPRGFWKAFKDYEGQPVNISEHQDAYEFFTRLQDSVDEYLRAQGHPRAIHAALGGEFAQVITVAGRPELRSQRDEEFYQISLDVRGKKGLTESLESYVAVELMNGENQWLCEELGRKVDAEKCTLFRTLPHTLMLHLKRFEWDYDTFSRWKIKDRFEFPENLDMRPYTVEGSAAAAAAGGGGGGGDGGDSSSNNPPSSPHPPSYYNYELRGIVVHSGTAFAGHYYSYIKDRESGKWHCFDDVSVDEWDCSTMAADCFGGKYRPSVNAVEYDRPNSAYMVLYERVEAVPMVVEEEEEEEEEKEKCKTVTTAAAAAAAAAPVQHTASNRDDSMLQGLNVHQQEAVARTNLQAIAVVHLLSLELLRFFTDIAIEMKTTVAPTQVKSRRVGFLSPGGARSFHRGAAAAAGGTAAASLSLSAPTGLARLASPRQRDDDIQGIVVQASRLCVQYCCTIIARDSQILAQELSKREKSLPILTCINAVFSTAPSSAHSFLELFATGGGMDGIFGRAITCPHDIIRDSLRTWIVQSVKIVESEFGVGSVVEVMAPIIAVLVGWLPLQQLKMQRFQREMLRYWEDVLILLNEVTSVSTAVTTLTVPHMETLLSIGKSVVDAFWKSVAVDDRQDYNFDASYLTVLSNILLRFDHRHLSNPAPADDDGEGAENGADEDDDDDGAENPHCVLVNGGTRAQPLPPYAYDFFFSENGFLRKLLMPGCLNSGANAALVQWLWYDNYLHYSVIRRAVAEHIEDDLQPDEVLAAELPFLVEILTMKDSFTEQRYR